MDWFAKRRWQDDVQDRLLHQLAEIRKEASSLGKQVARYGDHIQDDASGFGDAVWEGGEAVAKQIGREAKRFGRAVKEDPLPTIVAVAAIVGVVAALSIAFSRR